MFSVKVGDLDLKARRFLRVERIHGGETYMQIDAGRNSDTAVAVGTAASAAVAAPPTATGDPSDGDSRRAQRGGSPHAVAAATAPAAETAAGERGSRRHPRRRPARGARERAPDAFSKLADQWLRLQGRHPVTFEALCGVCPP